MSETTSAPAAPAAPAAAGDQARAGGAAAVPVASPAVPVTAAPVPVAPTTLLGDAPQAPDPAKPATEASVESPETKAPEAVTYEDFALPEGIAKDSPLLATFSVEAAKLGIPQDQAQALVSAVGEKLAADAKASGAAQMSAWVATNEAWQAEIRADKDIGGSKFEATKTNVAKLFDDYVGNLNSPERKALNEALLHTGAGNNPAIVRAFARIAAAHTEGGFVSGSPGRGPVDRAALLYPTMASGGARPTQG
jgi:hypothetical protein